MSAKDQTELNKTLWATADWLRGSMVAGDFRHYMLWFLSLRCLSDNYEAAAQKELGSDYPKEDVDTQLPLVSVEEDIKAAKDKHNAFLN